MADRRVALVTGSGQGIGKAIAEQLARDGLALILTQLEPDPLRQTEDRLAATGVPVLAQPGDLTNRADIERIVSAGMDQFGHIDVLVNNAGFNCRKDRFTELDIESWNAVLAGNLTAAFWLARLVAPGMIERSWGRIVNIGANQVRIPMVGNAAYVAAKAGLVGLTRSLATDLAEYGVIVNAVAPGGPILVDEEGPFDDGGLEWPTLLGRPGQAREVAALVSFLASEACTFTVGETIMCDGGRTLSRRADTGHGRTLADVLAWREAGR